MLQTPLTAAFVISQLFLLLLQLRTPLLPAFGMPTAMNENNLVFCPFSFSLS